jgi:hypothetical protein
MVQVFKEHGRAIVQKNRANIAKLLRKCYDVRFVNLCTMMPSSSQLIILKSVLLSL